MSRVYEPVTALPMETLPDTFVHPAGYCQNVLATGRCTVTGTALVDGPRGDPARSATTRAPSRSAGDRPDHRIEIAVDRQLGVILRLVESIGGGRHPRRRGHRSSVPRRRCHPPPSTSSSRPGRRCSTDRAALPAPQTGAYSRHRAGYPGRYPGAWTRPAPGRSERRASDRPRAAHRPAPERPCRSPSRVIHAIPAFRTAPRRTGCSRARSGHEGTVGPGATAGHPDRRLRRCEGGSR